MIGHEVEERNRIIGQNLRKYRLLKGMTQDELADGLCSVSQLSKVENGKTYVKRTILKQLAERLGVTVEKVESVDAMQEDLTEMLRAAKDAIAYGNQEIAFKLLDDLKQKCQEFDYPQLLSETIVTECWHLNNLRECEKAAVIIEQAMQENLITSDLHHVRLLIELGRSYELTGNMLEAINCYKRAEERFEGVEEDESISISIYFNLARCNFNEKNYASGMRYADKVKELAELHTRHVYRLRAKYLLAYGLHRTGRAEEAEELYVETLREAENNGFLDDVAIISNNYGEFLFEIGEYARARNYFRRTLTTFELIGRGIYVFESLIYLSDLEMLEGNTRSAIEYLHNVFTIAEKLEVGSYKFKAKALVKLGQIRRLQGDFEEHVRLTSEGLALYEKHYVFDEAFEVAADLAQTLDEQNDPRAIQFYRKAVQIQKEASRR